ncbi:hypothetical protein B0H11DRAFT_721093 [Mycena galericulata]|nr:hypothetical protein B0H11DRAFT_721093 [Mycena galericulata]
MLLRHPLLSLAFLQLWSSWLSALAQQQSFFPPAVPVAVRSPTFNCWLDTRNGSNPLLNVWPTFWNDEHILGWAGYIKVDGLTWNWLGFPVGNTSTLISTEITPTRTILTVQAGPMLLNVTFLSPVEPSNWALQSLPFSYVYVDGQALDGKSHSIQLYSDISAEWVSDSLSTAIQWNTSRTSNSVYHQVQSSTPQSVFTDVAEDSVAYYAIASVQPGLVSVIGNGVTLRGQFSAAGDGFTLTSDIPATFGNVESEGKFPVFAHALDLGQTETISSVAWVIGLVRDPVVTYMNAPRRAYFWSQYATIGDAIDAFVDDFPAARTRALAMDQQILQAAAKVSNDYGDLVSLATRQAMAGVEITLPTQAADGSWNLSDVQAFMKDVGNSQRVNPTEGIYAALPALLYLNASLSGALLGPLLQYQDSVAYANPYAASDLGFAYPAAPGDANDQDVYGVENSGNMLILALAHARTSGDGSLVSRYYSLLKEWADYLSTNALIPAQEIPADGLDSSLGQNHGNITNLAIKGIIAIQAMSEISKLVGEITDAQTYQTSASSLVKSWVNLASPSGHLIWTYGSPSSFGLMYNLLADRLLQLNVVPSSIYADESFALVNALPAPYGLPLSSDSNSNTRSDWALFSAAAAPDTTARNLLIAAVHKRASLNTTAAAGPFAAVYNGETGAGVTAGTPLNGFASPAQGAMFSMLALSVPNLTVIVPAQNALTPPYSISGGDSAPPESHAGVIAGGVIAVVAVLILLGLFAIFLNRRRRQSHAESVLVTPQPMPYQPSSTMSELMRPLWDTRGAAPSKGYIANPESSPSFPARKSRGRSNRPVRTGMMMEPSPPVPTASLIGATPSDSRGTEELRRDGDLAARHGSAARRAGCATRIPMKICS